MRICILVLSLLIIFNNKSVAQSLNTDVHFTYNDPDDLNDRAVDLLPQTDCGVVILSTVESFGSSTDILLSKYSATGDTIWTYRFDQSSGHDEAIKVISDGLGAFFVVGSSDGFGTGGGDLVVLKISSSGNLVWMNHLNVNSGYSDVATDIILSSHNILFVCGNSGPDAFMEAINPVNGNVIINNIRAGFDNVFVKMAELPNNQIAVIWNFSVNTISTEVRLDYYDATNGGNVGFDYWFISGINNRYGVDLCVATSGIVYVIGYQMSANSDTAMFLLSSNNFFNYLFHNNFVSTTSSLGKSIYINYNNEIISLEEFDSDTLTSSVDKAIRIIRFNSTGSVIATKSIGANDGYQQSPIALRKSSLTSGEITACYRQVQNSLNSNVNIVRLNSLLSTSITKSISSSLTSQNYCSTFKLDIYNNVDVCGFFESSSNLNMDFDFWKLTPYNYSNDSLYMTFPNSLHCSNATGSAYYWYLNGNYYNTTTTNDVQISQNGNYLCVLQKNCQLDTFAINVTNVGLDNIENKGDKFIIFPNPNHGNFNVLANSYLDARVVVYDMYGNVIVRDLFKKSMQMDLAKFGDGIYIIELENLNGTKLCSKLVVYGMN